ncbi:MAG: coproporphyrinogen III oxidase family protein [Steroidobacteraceae bacterium]
MTETAARAPWFEAPLTRILRHEYAAAMYFDAVPPTQLLPTPPAQACQLYVHVPFCESLCPFCSFHRVQFREEKARVYFEALRQEILSYHARGFAFSDVYVGGGTPTVAPAELARTLELIRKLWPVRTVSVETNPNHLTEEVFAALSSVGVGRLSVGVQSFDDELLKEMGRYEPYGSGALTAERIAAAQGRFATLNVDMIFNFARQTSESLERDLATLVDLKVDQVSFYPLMSAASARRRMQKTLGQSDPARRYDFYERILGAMLPDYRASSAWCFSRREPPGSEAPIDEYIINQDDYVGVGSGSFSYLNGRAYSTTFSLNRYRDLLKAGSSGITECKVLTAKQRMRYDFLMRLFGLSLPYAYIEAKYGRSFWWRMAPELEAMRLIGAIRHEANAIRLTARGMYVWVVMMAEFFASVNDLRDEMRLHIRDEMKRGPARQAYAR